MSSWHSTDQVNRFEKAFSRVAQGMEVGVRQLGMSMSRGSPQGSPLKQAGSVVGRLGWFKLSECVGLGGV